MKGQKRPLLLVRQQTHELGMSFHKVYWTDLFGSAPQRGLEAAVREEGSWAVT